MLDEGYIKYRSHWSPGPAPNAAAARLLEEWRRPLFVAGLIGQYEEHRIGFGNISIRCGEPGQFLITGTQTGHVEYSNEAHYSLVTRYDIARNEVSCAGPLQASSEAMTHAAIYELDSSINAIVHVHDKSLWDKYLNTLCTTHADIQYGTPEMAQEFRRLYEETAFRSQGIAVMGGHEEGLLSIGASLEQAATRILALTEGRKD
ncbi:MAG: class II aldolase/adducin family protein [Chromatiales bacterium]|jgi:ribulose-5-phosphate 4-epimerase/fuculose-1-phosphate aldolase|nr:MAG: class II aldolase/adducin family protein [Chromatiales bacterium]